jgi:hypothetical protein
MTPIRTFLTLALCTAIGFACSKRETDTASDTSYQYEYFPLQIGKVLEYQLDSLVYQLDSNGVKLIDSISMQVRDEVIDSVRSAANELQYIIVRSEMMPDGNLRPLRTMQIGRNQRQAWRIEDNFRLLKMPFPMTRRSAWDGLTYINRDIEVEVRSNRIRPFTNWEFEVDSLDIATTVGVFNFDSTLHITEADDINAIERRVSKVIYALHVGPVYMEQWILDSQYCNQTPPPTNCDTLPWEEKGERGYILRQRLTKY